MQRAIMWTAIATTCVTSSMFLTALAPNLLGHGGRPVQDEDAETADEVIGAVKQLGQQLGAHFDIDRDCISGTGDRIFGERGLPEEPELDDARPRGCSWRCVVAGPVAGETRLFPTRSV